MYTRNWECPACGVTESWTYEDLAAMGKPECVHCDVEMELQPEE